MINLIPTAAKKRVVMEYWVRTISSWAFLGGTALLLIATLSIPINIYVLNQEMYLAKLLEINESKKVDYEHNNALLLKANLQSHYLIQKNFDYTTRELLELLQESAEDFVSIEEVTISQLKDPVLVIGGVAHTRQSLVQFRDRLENEENFLSINLPINNLIKEIEVPFSITIPLATSTKTL